MRTLKIIGQVDEKLQLSARVPESLPPGPVTIIIVTHADEDEAGEAWMAGIAHEWADDLSDPRQDIYTLADGEKVAEIKANLEI